MVTLCTCSTASAAAAMPARDGGIETTDLVAAATARGWQALAGEDPSGSIARLQRQVDQGRPVIVLIEPTPGRFHYVVVVGVTPSSVVFHDPARTSFNVAAADEFVHEWRGSLNWRLVVLPPPTSGDVRSNFGGITSTAPSTPVVPQARAGACGALVDRGVPLADTDSSSAERVLTAASELCPASADPWLERAGWRFRAAAWREAAQLAERAAERDPDNDNAWALLATARYLSDDQSASLDAWNRIDAPTASTTRVQFEPVASGRAVVQGAIAERSPNPRHLMSWVVTGSRALFAHEIRGDFAGLMGQGEAATFLWRWPVDRPRVESRFAIPAPAPLPGIADIDVFWEAQSYAIPAGGALVFERDVESDILGSVRLDVARGLRDGRAVLSVGWSSSDSTVVNRRIRQ